MLGGYGRFRSPRIGSDRIAAGHPNARFNHIDTTWRPKPSIHPVCKEAAAYRGKKGHACRAIYIISTGQIKLAPSAHRSTHRELTLALLWKNRYVQVQDRKEPSISFASGLREKGSRNNDHGATAFGMGAREGPERQESRESKAFHQSEQPRVLILFLLFFLSISLFQRHRGRRGGAVTDMPAGLGTDR